MILQHYTKDNLIDDLSYLLKNYHLVNIKEWSYNDCDVLIIFGNMVKKMLKDYNKQRGFQRIPKQEHYALTFPKYYLGEDSIKKKANKKESKIKAEKK